MEKDISLIKRKLSKATKIYEIYPIARKLIADGYDAGTVNMLATERKKALVGITAKVSGLNKITADASITNKPKTCSWIIEVKGDLSRPVVEFTEGRKAIL